MTRALHEALLDTWEEGFYSKAELGREIGMARTTLLGWLGRTPGQARYRASEKDEAYLEALEELRASESRTAWDWSEGGMKVRTTAKEPIRTLDDVYEACGLDKAEWKAVRVKGGGWTTAMKLEGDDGQEIPHVEQNHKIEATFEPAHERRSVKAFVEGLLDETDVSLPSVHVSEAPATEGELAGLLSIPDVHIGKFVWAEKAGEEYDLASAEALYRRAVDSLLAKIDLGPGRLDRIYVPVGNDAAHIDGIGQATTGGTRQDTDGLWQHIARVVARCNRYALDRTREVAPVVGVVCPGNHDEADSYYQGLVLEAAYEDAEHVRISNGPTLRKVERFGDCLLMWDHGKEVALKDLPMHMANRFPTLWGQTRWREIHTGHKHKRSKESVGDFFEIDGVIVRISPSLAAPDAWHQRKGYTDALRGAEAFLYHRKAGYAGNLPFNVLPSVAA